MPLKNNWTNRRDEIDDVVADDINKIAAAVIELEENIGEISLALDDLHAYAQSLAGGDS